MTIRNIINDPEASKNLDTIKRQLSELKISPGRICFYFCVGDFIIRIFTPISKDWKTTLREKMQDCITHHNELQVNLYELKKMREGGTAEYIIHLGQDPRFSNSSIWTENEVSADSSKMTTIQLCELIRYLYRLNNLKSFL